MILFDISSLLNRRYRTSPTGIDRVSFRYLHYFLSLKQDTVYFVQQKKKQIDVISKDYVNDFYNRVVNNWGMENNDAIDYQEMAESIIECPEQYSNIVKKIDPHHESTFLAISDTAMLDQYYRMDYEYRLTLLMNADLSRLIGKHFVWFNKMPSSIKKMIFIIAARSRTNALIHLKIGRFIGHLLDLKNIKSILNGYYSKYKYSKNVNNLLDNLRNKDKDEPVIYINTSHYLTLSNKLLNDYVKLFNFKYVFFVHDILQLETPEYFSVNSQPLFKQFINNAVQFNASFIVNSEYTERRLSRYIDNINNEYSGKTLVDHIGIENHFQDAHKPASTSVVTNYFVVISTIEPRKNHLLLLNIWRKFHDCGMENIPKLFLIGNRGWENENIIDMLERCPALMGNVFEFNHLNDALLIPILSNARALLSPSHYEGWGMPVVEALTLQVPVICSDIPALREAGQNIPEYIDPLDGMKWMDTIIEYSNDDSTMRKEQLEQIKDFKTPTWDNHFNKLQGFIDELAVDMN